MNSRNLSCFNLIIGVSLVTLAATSLAPAQTLELQDDSGNAIHIMAPPGPPSPAPSPFSPRLAVTNSNMVSGGGPVMRNPTNYIIFWQPPGKAAFPAGYIAGIQSYFQDVGGTPFYSMLSQYNDTTLAPVPNSTSLGGTFTDTTTAPPSGCNGTPTGAIGATPNCPLTDGDIRAEVNHAIAANPLWQAPGLSTMYFVFTPSDVGECFNADCFASNLGVGPGENSAFCAYHSFFNTNKIYAYQPYSGNGNCTIQSVFPNGHDVDITLSTVSHEMFEANTDPLLNGWKGPGGNDDENGDKCSYTQNGGPGFTAPDGTNLVLNGHRYQIQWEWSNAVNGCTKRLDPPAANISTPVGLNFGTHQAGTASVTLPLNIANNAGSGDANILYIRLGGGSSSRFSIPSIPPTWATLKGSETLGETVAFNPLAPQASATGTVIIDTDYTTSALANEITVNLAGVVVLAPTISKSFAAPKKVLPGGTIALSFTVGNPNSVAALPGVGFTDTLPANLVVATPNGLSGSCGGGTIAAVAGSNIVSLANATLPISTSCTFSVNVTAITEGIFINTTGAVFSTYGSGGTATDNLIAATPPRLTKSFGNILTLLPGGTTGLAFSLTNPNSIVTLSGLAFSDTLPAGLLVSNPNGLTGSCDGGTITATAGSNLVSLTGATLAPGASCSFTVNVTAGASEIGQVTNTTSTVTSTEALPGAAASASIFIGNAFQVRSASNLGVGDSVVNTTNSGTSSTTAFPTQNGNLCVNVYTFSPDEQLIACCTCPVTPDGLDSLSARNDLISNTLTPGVPTSVVVKLLASTGAPTCNASTVGLAGNALATGLAAWGTTIHGLPVTAGSPATTYGVTETPFTPSTLSVAELSRITTLCGFIQSNGSGFGICRSCRLGGLGDTQ